MGGNLVIFKGAAELNEYGHKLRSNPVYKFLEWYLIAGFATHGVTGFWRTYQKRKFIFPTPQAALLNVGGYPPL